MTEVERLLPILSLLSLAYPEKRLNPETIQLYLKYLADIPDYLLEEAVRAHIQSSPYFPRLSELRALAQRLASGRSFKSLPADPVDRLAAEAQALEDAFYETGELEPAAWESLAERFESAERPYRAEHTRAKLRRLRAIDGWTAGDEPPGAAALPEQERHPPEGESELEGENDGNIY